jgi:hypothetical protein
MVACLRPGGWLIDEEGDWGVPGPVDPSHPRYAGYHRTEALDDEHQVLTAPCGDPSVWFITELLHACSGQRPGQQRARMTCDR